MKWLFFKIRCWFWKHFKRPFQTFIYIHEQTKIVVRQFPWKLEIQQVPSLQERIDKEKTVQLEPATYIINSPIILKTGTRLDARQAIMKQKEKENE